jgi:hypothetical protein
MIPQTEAKHTPTPGPWKVFGNSIKAVSHGKWFTIARVEPKLFTREGAQSNARLIAAAPDLLAALRKSEHYLNRFYVLAIQCADDPRYLVERDAINEAQAAIYKATTA